MRPLKRRMSNDTFIESYPNEQHKTHKRSRVKNKYRNMACPCGSGKKFKKCCIGKVN